MMKSESFYMLFSSEEKETLSNFEKWGVWDVFLDRDKCQSLQLKEDPPRTEVDRFQCNELRKIEYGKERITLTAIASL